MGCILDNGELQLAAAVNVKELWLQTTQRDLAVLGQRCRHGAKPHGRGLQCGSCTWSLESPWCHISGMEVVGPCHGWAGA